MNFNKHSEFEGQHAFLSASKYYWLTYENEDILYERYKASYAPLIGTASHELAAKLIKNRFKLTKKDWRMLLFHLISSGIPQSCVDSSMFDNFMEYVNDSISYRMSPEQILYYSDNCFGTTDSISFDKNFLRIHDYKSGRIPAHIEQLEIYAALFCLEYRIAPGTIDMELRIYQNDGVLTLNPTAEDILPIMDKIKTFDKAINRMKGSSK